MYKQIYRVLFLLYFTKYITHLIHQLKIPVNVGWSSHDTET